MNSRYGTGGNGIRVERSHPEEDQRNLQGPRNYYSMPKPKQTQEERLAEEAAEKIRREEAKRRFRELSGRK